MSLPLHLHEVCMPQAGNRTSKHTPCSARNMRRRTRSYPCADMSSSDDLSLSPHTRHGCHHSSSRSSTPYHPHHQQHRTTHPSTYIHHTSTLYISNSISACALSLPSLCIPLCLPSTSATHTTHATSHGTTRHDTSHITHIGSIHRKQTRHTNTGGNKITNWYVLCCCVCCVLDHVCGVLCECL